jgi:small subunit ribosomal protein S8
MTNYPVGDFLIRIKNAKMATLRNVSLPNTKFIYAVAQALKDEKYLSDIDLKDGILTVSLAFYKKEPLLENIKLVSKPGLRLYVNARELSLRKSPSILILSTSAGVMSSKKALKKGLGGQVIAEIW